MTGFDGYSTDGFYDEMFASDGRARPAVQMLVERIESFPDGELTRRQIMAEHALLRMGITFNVYADEQGSEKIFPFDLIPRIIDANEWEWIERGLKQRIHALNLFIDDVYHDQKILKEGVVPADVVLSSERYLQQCIGLDPPRGIWCHITGTDLVRDSDGQIYVLEDNLGCPSGVSYVVENRQLMKRTFPQLFGTSQIQPVEDFPSQLLNMLRYLATAQVASPEVAVLTPGIYNSAYFEHSFLAQQMGVELVEGRDLVVMDGFVHMRTTKGFERVDVLYRRINDDFLDPKVFQPESMLGVPGLIDVYKAGRIALVNAPGTCVADDKVVCFFRATDHQVLSRGRHYHPKCSDLYVLGGYRTKICARASRRTRCKRSEPVWWVWDAHRTSRNKSRTRGVCPPHQSEPAQLHRATDPFAFTGACAY